MKVRIGVACLVVLLAAGSLISCGGGGGGAAAPACTTCSNVAGIWDMTEVNSSSTVDCAGTDFNTYTITQTACNITASRGGVSRSGTICNNTLGWTGSYPEGLGTVTIHTMSLTVSGTTTSTVSGSSSWTYTQAGWGSCTGTTAISGTKQ